MSTPLWRAVVDSGHLPLTPAARLVLHVYAARAGADGLAWPAQASVAEATGLSERSVRRALLALEDLALVVPVGRGPANVVRYLVTVPEAPTTERLASGHNVRLPEHSSPGHNVRPGHPVHETGHNVRVIRTLCPPDRTQCPTKDHEGSLNQHRSSERELEAQLLIAREAPAAHTHAHRSTSGGVGELAELEALVIAAKPLRRRTVSLGDLEARALAALVETHGAGEVARALEGLQGEYERPLQAAAKQLERRDPW